MANDANLRDWRFRVSAAGLSTSESVCITGDCPVLGNWSHENVVALVKDDDIHWSITVKIPFYSITNFRYCICLTSADRNQVLIRQWETHNDPRKILAGFEQSDVEVHDFGRLNGIQKVDKGWLTTGSILQLKFYNNPFVFKTKLSEGTLSVKLTPLKSQFNLNNEALFLCEESSSMSDVEPPRDVIIEVATLEKNNSLFKTQDQFGHIIKTDDFLLFNVTVPSNEGLTYLVDFYKHGSQYMHIDMPVHIGYSYILPNVLSNSEGHLQLPITCSLKHRPIGVMNVEFLIIRPLATSLCNMKESYSSHWSESWIGLDVGHRGMGSSFKTHESTIRENTIASLKQAALSGADLLEFDVQLSKDLVPVIYHDFHVCIALKKKTQLDFSEMLEIPMMDLTLDQLQKLKVYHVVEGRNREPRFFDEDLEEHQPFPLLSDALQMLDPSVGFNIEIKWSLKLEDGGSDLQNTIDLNLYIDKILEVVLKTDVKRRIVFSCFHPDVCTMVRVKQNIYPTMFLTQGVTKRYPKLHDIRCHSIQEAIHHALNASLLGIVVHTEDLLRDPSQVQLVIDAGLIIFCWGDDNNSKQTINHLKKLGLHAVIFDRLDQYSSKEVKESIFLMEAREAQKSTLNASVIKSQDSECGQGDGLQEDSSSSSVKK